MGASRAGKIAISLFLVVAVIGVVTRTSFYLYGMSEEFFSWMLLSIVFIHLRVWPDWRDVVGIVAAAAMFALIDLEILHYQFYVIASISFLGMGSLLVMGLDAIWLQSDQKQKALLAFIPSVLIVAANFFAGNAHHVTEKLHPKALDLYLYSFDSSLHLQPAFLVGQAFAKWQWFNNLGLSFYIGLPFTIAFTYAGQVLRMGKKAIPIFTALFLVGPVGVLFYNFFPALGPKYLFLGRFPWQPLTIDQARRLLLEPLAMPGMRNAMPSLHMAWVLLAFWCSRGLSIYERSIALAFVVFTVFATLGTGEHYFIDLIVAFPFAVFIQALCATKLSWSDRRRYASFLFGLLTTFVWLATLRFVPKLFWISAAIPWTCCVATIVLTELVRRTLTDSLTKVAAARRMHDVSEPFPVGNG